MNIKVELNDGEMVAVSRKGLDRLLEHCLVRRFQRNSGWAVVGIHPVRVSQSDNDYYNGRERRSQRAGHSISQHAVSEAIKEAEDVGFRARDTHGKVSSESRRSCLPAKSQLELGYQVEQRAAFEIGRTQWIHRREGSCPAGRCSGLTAALGLGLTISHQPAGLMGGDLTYRYEQGESVFELSLPVSR